MVAGIPVVTTCAEVDVTNARRLRAALLDAASRHGTLVVDMSQAQSCDTAGIHALVGAHKRAQAVGGQVLLITVRCTYPEVCPHESAGMGSPLS
jgi:anti-anti-sigma factor